MKTDEANSLLYRGVLTVTTGVIEKKMCGEYGKYGYMEISTIAWRGMSDGIVSLKKNATRICGSLVSVKLAGSKAGQRVACMNHQMFASPLYH